MTHYFCYQCERAVPIETGENLQCPRCAGDFLEELAANDPRMPSSQPFGMPRIPVGAQSPGRSAGQSIPTHSPNAVRVSLMDLLLMTQAGAGPLAAMQGPPQPTAVALQNRHASLEAHRARVHQRVLQRNMERAQAQVQAQYGSGSGSGSGSAAEDAGDSDDQYEDVDSSESSDINLDVGGADVVDGVQISGLDDDDVLDGEEEEQEEQGDEEGNEDGGEQVELENSDEEQEEEEGEDDEEDDGHLGALHRLMGMLLTHQGNGNRALTLQNFLQAMGPSLGYYGNPGDYVTQEQYDALISRMMDEKKPDFKPASEDFIEALEKRTYTSTDGQLDCSVCRDDFKEGEVYNVLPCTHLFHKDCITSWLKENNNCPLCRQKFDSKSE